MRIIPTFEKVEEVAKELSIKVELDVFGSVGILTGRGGYRYCDNIPLSDFAVVSGYKWIEEIEIDSENRIKSFLRKAIKG